MTTTTITAGGTSPDSAFLGGNDGTLLIQTGPSNGKVNAISIAADGTPTFLKVPANTAVQSMVRLSAQNGYGSTNTAIRRWATTLTNQGSDITYLDSPTLGGKFTINTSGVYSISYSDVFSAAANCGVLLNPTNVTGNMNLCSAAEVLIAFTTSAGGYASAGTWTGYLAAGSVVQVNASAATSTSSVFQTFTITRVA